jgi:aspartyl-tRNA(Asn)/glutamyl-tRNA(Gln) amidotransferase subunit C
MSEKIVIEIAQIHNIARLARLAISEDEARDYSLQLSKALSYFDQISEVDTIGVEPMVTPIEITNNLRSDEAITEHTTDELLANAPRKTGNLFTVPPVI